MQFVINAKCLPDNFLDRVGDRRLSCMLGHLIPRTVRKIIEMESHPEEELNYADFRKLIYKSPARAAHLWDTRMTGEAARNLIFLAAEKLHLDVLKWTLANRHLRKRIDARMVRSENDEWTLLHFVCTNHDHRARHVFAALKFLVRSAGCEVNLRDSMGRTPFHQICASHLKRDWKGRRIYIRILRFLIEHGANVNDSVNGITPLHIVHESPWAVRYLVVSANATPNVEDPYQRTPLFWGLRNIHFPAAKWFPVSVFRDRVDFRKTEFMGQSVMHFAILRAQSETLDVVELLMERLIDAGADVNAQNGHLRTPLFYLIHSPDLIPLAKQMIEKFGADVNICDADGYTVAHLAAVMGKLDYVAIFLPHLHFNIVTPTGDTVRSCVEKYCPRSVLTLEVKKLLKALDEKDKVFSKRCEKKTYNVYEYVKFLDEHRDLLSLYVVETFYRYRGGRTIFTDIFHHIGHSVWSKERARNFIHEITQWRGDSNALRDIIDNHSVGTIHYEQESNCSEEPCRIGRSVREMVQELMDTVRRNNGQWLLEVVPMGSATDGSKILIPNEFDFLIIFQRIRPEDEMVSSAKDLGLIENFQIALQHAMQQRDAEMLCTKQRRPLGFQFVDCELRRVGLNMRLTWFGDDQRYGNDFEGLNISVDLIPVYHLTGWQNRSGLRHLRSYQDLPDWFKQDQIIEHYRPVHNQVVVLPCAASMEARCFSNPKNIFLQYTLRLLKLVVQCDHILQDVTAPNSHFLKTAVLCYAHEKGLPTGMEDVASCVTSICDRFRSSIWSKEIRNFVADAKLNNPLASLMVKPHGRDLALESLRRGLSQHNKHAKS